MGEYMGDNHELLRELLITMDTDIESANAAKEAPLSSQEALSRAMDTDIESANAAKEAPLSSQEALPKEDLPGIPIKSHVEEDSEQSCTQWTSEFCTPSVLIGLLSAVCASLYSTGTKIATDKALSPGSHITVPFLILLRGIVGVVIVSYEAFYLEGEHFPPGRPEQLPLMGTAGVLTALGAVFGLYAVSMWGAASVACIVNTSPALTIGLSAICCIPNLHEPLTLSSCTLVATALIGVILVARPDFIWGDSKSASSVGIMPPLAAIGQAVMQSVTALMIRNIPNKPTAACITFYVQLSILFLGGGLTTYTWIHTEVDYLDWDDWVAPMSGILMVSVCGTGANYFKNKALRISKSVLVVGLRFFTPVLCYALDAILMNFSRTYAIHSDKYSYIGCTLIVIAGLLLILLKRNTERGEGQLVCCPGKKDPLLLYEDLPKMHSPDSHRDLTTLDTTPEAEDLTGYDSDSSLTRPILGKTKKPGAGSFSQQN